MNHIENYAALIENLQRSTVQVLSGRGGGSGVVSDRGGLIVTNAHVAAGRYAEVVDAAGQRRRARIIRRDRERDLAPGYSGGILADAGGRVIGINTMIIFGSAFGRGIGLAIPCLAIPSNEVSKFVREDLRGARAA